MTRILGSSRSAIVASPRVRRPGNDGRGRRPPGSPCHHLRDERRELPPPCRTRTQARPRPPASPRDNHGQRLIAAPLHLKPQFRLRDNHAATIMPMPRHRIPILIAAPFPSRSPRYSPDPKRNQPGDPRCGMHRLSSETQHPSRRLRLPRASCSKGAPSRHRKGRQPLHRRHSACFRLRRVAKRALSAAVSLPRPQRGRAGAHGVRRRPRPHRRR